MYQRLLFCLVLLAPLCHQSQAQTRHGSHGMLIFGQGTTYISHLGMYHKPHDRQIVIQLADTFQWPEQTTPETQMYTFLPHKFDLNLLSSTSTPAKLCGDLYQGHFERGGKLIKQALCLKLSKTLIHRSLAADMPKTNTVSVFNGKYLIGHIGPKPGVDLIAVVESTGMEGQWEASTPISGIAQGENVTLRQKNKVNKVLISRIIYRETRDFSY